MISASGQIYDGYWKDDMAHGKGKNIDECGAIYEGDWYQEL